MMRHYTRTQKKNFLFVYLLIAFPVVQFLVFWLFVNVNSIALAFTDDITKSFTFANFGEVWKNVIDFKSSENIPTMVLRSCILWATTNILAFPIGLASTYVLYKRIPGHYVYRVIYSIPAIVGSVLWVAMIQQVMSYDGIFVYILKKVWTNIPEEVLIGGLLNCEKTAFPTLVAMAFFTGIVGGSVIATGAYTKIPQELQEAGQLDGLDFWGGFLHIALPCAWPTISTLLTISLCGILVTDGCVYLYSSTGDPGIATMGYYLYRLTVTISEQSGTSVIHYGYPAALGLCISLVSMPIVFFGRWVLRKLIPTVEV